MKGVVNLKEIEVCPFCGDNATLKNGIEGKCNKYHYVVCNDCGSQTKRFFESDGNNDKTAIESWNNRIN